MMQGITPYYIPVLYIWHWCWYKVIGDGQVQGLIGGRMWHVSPPESLTALSTLFPVRCWVTKHHVAASVWGQINGSSYCHNLTAEYSCSVSSIWNEHGTPRHVWHACYNSTHCGRENKSWWGISAATSHLALIPLPHLYNNLCVCNPPLKALQHAHGISQ